MLRQYCMLVKRSGKLNILIYSSGLHASYMLAIDFLQILDYSIRRWGKHQHIFDKNMNEDRSVCI